MEIRRTFIFEDMVKAFKDDSIANKALWLIPVNTNGKREEADDFGGVFRDLLSAFWSEFFNKAAQGMTVMVPSIRHDFNMEDWQSICRILLKGYQEVKYFPLQLDKSFVISTLFGEKELKEDILMDSFLKYLPTEESDTVEAAMKKEFLDSSDEDEDVVDILASLGSKRVPKTGSDLHAVVLELAHQEIIQKPSYIRESWDTITSTWNPFQNVDNLHTIYADAKPSVKRVTKLFVCNPENDREKEVFEYLKRFLRGLNGETLAKFLRYVTGADMLCVQKIDVMFNNLSGCERRIVAHTCGPTVELPRLYDSFLEFKEEFHAILQSGYWNMDFV